MKQNNNLAVVRIVILGIIAVLLLGIMILLLTRSFNLSNIFGSFEKNSKIIYEEQFPVTEVKELVVSGRSDDVTVEESLGQEIEVIVRGKKEKEVNVSLENNTLKVEKDILNNFCIGFCFDYSNIVIKVPTSYSGKFQLKSVSGEIIVPNFSKVDMDVTTTSGDINIQGGKNLKVNSVSGEITIGAGESLKGNTTSGDIEITSLKNICEINSVSGSIEITQLTLTENSTIKTVSGDVEIKSLNEVYVETDTLSGNVSVNNNHRQAPLELKIKTTSGDIDVGRN